MVDWVASEWMSEWPLAVLAIVTAVAAVAALLRRRAERVGSARWPAPAAADPFVILAGDPVVEP